MAYAGGTYQSARKDPPGSRESSAVTGAVNYFAKPQKLFNVSAGSFMPAPKVDSSVIKLDIYEKPAVSPIDERLYFRIVRAAFNQRRKTLPNALSSGLNMDKAVILQAIKSAGLSETIRGEALKLEDFCRLSDALSEIAKQA